jgi:hypothetical protein
MKINITVEVEIRPLLGPDPEPGSQKAKDMAEAARQAVVNALEMQENEIGFVHGMGAEAEVRVTDVDVRNN